MQRYFIFLCYICKKDKNMEISEVGKVAAIDKLFEGSGYENKVVIKYSGKDQSCMAHKMLLEDVDFVLSYNPLKHLGYKAVLSVVGEIYSKLYAPISLSVSIALSSRFNFENIKELLDGIFAAAKEHSIKEISLDLVPSASGLCISLAAMGAQKKEILKKCSDSKSFDLICLSGNVGAAYMGFHVLERERVVFASASKAESKDAAQPDLSKYKYILESYLSPEVSPSTVDRFIESGIIPSRGYFLTKGLGASIKELCKDTQLGAKIYLEKIPISSRTFSMSEELNLDAVTAALNGGDDYKFLFTVPIEKHETFLKEFADYDVIGHLAQSEVGSVLVTPEGAEIEIKAQGW